MKRYIFIILFLCSVHINLMAQHQETQIKQKISQVAATMKTMQCDFVQTKHLKILNEKMVSKGCMFYQRSNCLRWEYNSPYTYIFILNNDKVLLKNKQRNDIIDVKQNKVFKEIAHIMMNSVVGNCLNDDKSFNSSVSVVGGEWVATLLPLRKDMKQIFQSIVLHFSQKQAVVTQVELTERNGDKTVIELKNIKTNGPINANMFALH